MAQIVTLQIEVPSNLAAFLGDQFQAAEVVKEYIVLGLYQENRISGGKAAELLGVTRRGFVALLACKGIDTFRLTSDEWAEVVDTVKAVGCRAFRSFIGCLRAPAKAAMSLDG